MIITTEEILKSISLVWENECPGFSFGSLAKGIARNEKARNESLVVSAYNGTSCLTFDANLLAAFLHHFKTTKFLTKSVRELLVGRRDQRPSNLVESAVISAVESRQLFDFLVLRRLDQAKQFSREEIVSIIPDPNVSYHQWGKQETIEKEAIAVYALGQSWRPHIFPDISPSAIQDSFTVHCAFPEEGQPKLRPAETERSTKLLAEHTRATLEDLFFGSMANTPLPWSVSVHQELLEKRRKTLSDKLEQAEERCPGIIKPSHNSICATRFGQALNISFLEQGIQSELNGAKFEQHRPFTFEGIGQLSALSKISYLASLAVDVNNAIVDVNELVPATKGVVPYVDMRVQGVLGFPYPKDPVSSKLWWTKDLRDCVMAGEGKFLVAISFNNLLFGLYSNDYNIPMFLTSKKRDNSHQVFSNKVHRILEKDTDEIFPSNANDSLVQTITNTMIAQALTGEFPLDEILRTAKTTGIHLSKDAIYALRCLANEIFDHVILKHQNLSGDAAKELVPDVESARANQERFASECLSANKDLSHYYHEIYLKALTQIGFKLWRAGLPVVFMTQKEILLEVEVENVIEKTQLAKKIVTSFLTEILRDPSACSVGIKIGEKWSELEDFSNFDESSPSVKPFPGKANKENMKPQERSSTQVPTKKGFVVMLRPPTDGSSAGPEEA